MCWPYGNQSLLMIKFKLQEHGWWPPKNPLKNNPQIDPQKIQVFVSPNPDRVRSEQRNNSEF